MPNSRSRSRSSTTGWRAVSRRRRPPRRSPWRSGGRGHKARRGRPPARRPPAARRTSGRAPPPAAGRGRRAARRRRAARCRSSSSPAACAASRATLPALCPWRTIQSFSGHLCLTGGTKRDARRQRFRSGGEQALRASRRARRSSAPVNRCAFMPDRLGAGDVDLPVVDEQGLVRPQAEAVERQIIDRRHRASAASPRPRRRCRGSGRRRRALRAWKGGQKSAEKLVIANSGTPRSSSSATISCMPGTGPVIVSPKRSLQAAIRAAYSGNFSLSSAAASA